MLSKAFKEPIRKYCGLISELPESSCTDPLRHAIWTALKKIYHLNHQAAIIALCDLWKNDPSERLFGVLLNLNSSPFAENFLKDIGSLVKNQLKTETPDLLEVLLELVSFCSNSTYDYSNTFDLGVLNLVFLKEYLSNSIRYREWLPLVFELTTKYLIKISRTEDVELKRLGRDISELYQKVAESSIMYCSRLLEPLQWKELPTVKASSWSEYRNDVESSMTRLCPDSTAKRIFDIIESLYLPNLTGILTDADRYITTVNFVITNLVLPVFKGSIRRHYPGVIGLACFICLVRQPPALKSWKRDFMEGTHYLRCRFNLYRHI